MASEGFPLDDTAYVPLKLIGDGATATVYVARCRTNGRLVALKRIDLDRHSDLEQCRAEVDFWTSCDHPNIVRYFGSFVQGPDLLILMEFMNRGSCADLLNGSFPQGIRCEAVVATILHDVTQVLAYFQSNRRLHRDVKPANILLSDDGRIKVADFGAAAELLEQGHLKRARFTVTGTPCYMAPEMITPSGGYTEEADIWSLGITAIELATGNAPYSNLHPIEIITKIRTSPPPQLPNAIGWSPAFHDFVRMCLQEDPAKRATAAKLLGTKFLSEKMEQSEFGDFLNAVLPELDIPKTPEIQVPPPKEHPEPVWDFDTEATESSTKKEAASTITQEPDDERIAELEQEVRSLRQTLIDLNHEYAQLFQEAQTIQRKMAELQTV
jgi:serine/threonine-protein kinase OSR1/STK39